MKKDNSKVTTIRLNEEELESLRKMSYYLGLDSMSGTMKCCLTWGKQRIEMFLREFESVIQPLKKSEIDSLITTMSILGKNLKDKETTKFKL
jgi:hypothetical protein|tara:strand:- start:697 stop:972 length:276 start_codon:yes stop_codon:yes gene_type:complete